MLAAWIFLPKILASSIISAARAHSSAGQSARFTSVRSLVRVQLRPPVQYEPLDMPVERFLASVRFEHRSKLDQLGIDLGIMSSKMDQ